MNLVPLHKALIAALPDQFNLWRVTTAANPVAVLGWGQPLPLSVNPGYVICAAECRSVLSALDWMTTKLADPTTSELLFPGWCAPFAHVIAVEQTSETTLSVVGWSGMSGEATMGVLSKPPHPEFPDELDLIRVGAKAVIQSRRDMTLTLIANLAHLDIFLPGML